jgi:lysophospholipase L1-like esterase
MANLIALGDSNTGNSYNPYYVTATQTYFYLLATEIGLTPVNAGVSGNKASDMLARLSTVMGLGSAGDFVLIMTGTNESDASVTNGTTVASVRATYRADMEEIVDTLQTNGFKPIVVTPPDSLAIGMTPRLSAIRDEALALGIEYLVPVVDLYAKMRFDYDRLAFSTYKGWFKDNSGSPDSYHLSVNGHAWCADFAAKAIVLGTGEPPEEPPVEGQITKIFDGVTTTASTTLTFSSKSLGTADADRVISVKVHRYATAAAHPTAVTIGGVSATMQVGSNSSVDGYQKISIWTASVPSGTTGDIVLTFASSSHLLTSVVGHRVLSSSETPASTQTDNTATSNAFNFSITCPTGGSGLCATSADFITTGRTIAWTNATEDYENTTARTDLAFGTAHSTTAGSLSITAQFSASIVGGAMIGVAFNPA